MSSSNDTHLSCEITDLDKELENTKVVIRIRKSKKGQRENNKRTNNDLQNIHCTHKAKDRVTRAPLKTVGELRCSGRVDIQFLHSKKL